MESVQVALSNMKQEFSRKKQIEDDQNQIEKPLKEAENTVTKIYKGWNQESILSLAKQLVESMFSNDGEKIVWFICIRRKHHHMGSHRR